jgi:imidazolonepropionase-like amidohydrolase
MKMRFVVACIPLLIGPSAAAVAENKTALVNGTLIDPGTAKIMPSAIVLIEGDRISAVGDQATAISTKDARVIDCKGKFIVPGYIDTHVHFFHSGSIYTRPDVIDLTSLRSFKDEHAWVERNLRDTFERYLRSGVTAVIDVGGPMWNFRLRELARSIEKAPRLAVAGPLISSVSSPQIEFDGHASVVKIDTPEQGRAMVQKLGLEQPDYVKIWYIVDAENPVEKFRPVVHAVIEESHRLKLRVAVHATELEAARAAVEEGADLLVHSVMDKLVDEHFVQLLKEKRTILTPTLVVFERYGRTFANKIELTPEEKAWGNPEVIASLDVTKLPAEKVPDRIKSAVANPQPTLDHIQRTNNIALKNLKMLQDGGITIATGTDAGNIGTIHGPSIFREFQLMKEAGLTPMQILQCSTANAAKTFGGDTGAKIGSLKAGNFADLVILKSNPLDDIKHASDIDSVMKNGILYPAGALIQSPQ